MVKLATFILLTVSVIALTLMPAYADLTPMSWGFPTFLQNSSLSNYEQDFGFNSDFESSAVSFPTTSSSSAFGTAFPTILQISNKTSMAGVVRFSQAQQSAQFSYPWMSIGFSPVPSMGFL